MIVFELFIFRGMGLAYNNYFGINATLSAMEYVLTI